MLGRTPRVRVDTFTPKGLPNATSRDAGSSVSLPLITSRMRAQSEAALQKGPTLSCSAQKQNDTQYSRPYWIDLCTGLGGVEHACKMWRSSLRVQGRTKESTSVMTPERPMTPKLGRMPVAPTRSAGAIRLPSVSVPSCKHACNINHG
jgi:hypothetical protein